MASYRLADDDLGHVVEDLIDRYHRELAEAGVTVRVLYAHAPRNETTGEPRGPALAERGWALCAKVKVNSLRDRVSGLPDATIILDGDNWLEWPEKKQAAVLDHQLHALEVRQGDDGEVLLDDANRPKLKVRQLDHRVEVYEEVLRRHREFDPAAKAAEMLGRVMRQLELPWG